MEGHGSNFFDLSKFDLMPIRNNLEGGVTKDTPHMESLGEDWEWLHPLLQEPMGIPPPTPVNPLSPPPLLE